MTASVTVTERAAERIAQIVSNEPENNMLRVSVEGGGYLDFPVFSGEPFALAVWPSGTLLRTLSD